MITCELFNRNEVLRGRLADALDVLELAFTAVEGEVEKELSVNTRHDALEYAMAHAQRSAITNFKDRIRKLAQVPPETIGPLEASYNGVDPFEQLKIDAEAEHAKRTSKPAAMAPAEPSPLRRRRK